MYTIEPKLLAETYLMLLSSKNSNLSHLSKFKCKEEHNIYPNDTLSATGKIPHILDALASICVSEVKTRVFAVSLTATLDQLPKTCTVQVLIAENTSVPDSVVCDPP
jgi:hypothetical protein